MKKEALKFYLPAEDVQWLRHHAEEDGRPITWYLTKIVRKYREECEAKTKAAA